MKNWLNIIFVAIAAAGGYLMAVSNLSTEPTPNLTSLLTDATYVELSHTLSNDIPGGPGPEPSSIVALLSHTPGEGVMGGTGSIHRYSFPGQWGTHVDAPIHFIEGKRTLEDIPLNEMVLPLIVIDIHKQVQNNPDYQVRLEDIAAWESVHGIIPEKTFVALRTDWSKRWPDMDQIRNWDTDGKSHSPGWSMEVLDYLVLKRNITAIGHETMDTDTGSLAAVGEYPLEAYFLGLDKYQIENMTNLDKLPPIGAHVIATWMNSKEGAGFPARVFAIIPVLSP